MNRLRDYLNAHKETIYEGYAGQVDVNGGGDVPDGIGLGVLNAQAPPGAGNGFIPPPPIHQQLLNALTGGQHPSAPPAVNTVVQPIGGNVVDLMQDVGIQDEDMDDGDDTAMMGDD